MIIVWLIAVWQIDDVLRIELLVPGRDNDAIGYDIVDIWSAIVPGYPRKLT